LRPRIGWRNEAIKGSVRFEIRRCERLAQVPEYSQRATPSDTSAPGTAALSGGIVRLALKAAFSRIYICEQWGIGYPLAWTDGHGTGNLLSIYANHQTIGDLPGQPPRYAGPAC